MAWIYRANGELSANAREGANQPNSYNLNRYVHDAQGSINDQLARFMVVYKQNEQPSSK